jgi:hypothetical protein
MKTWLAKFRISAALDAGQPVSERTRKKIQADEELRRFARQLDGLDLALGARPAAPAPDPALHGSIMRAVRGAARKEPARRVWFGWLPIAGAVATVAALCLAIFAHRPEKQTPTPAVATAAQLRTLEESAAILHLGGQMTRAMPEMVMSPLSNEWASVDRDARDTARVLIASLP